MKALLDLSPAIRIQACIIAEQELSRQQGYSVTMEQKEAIRQDLQLMDIQPAALKLECSDWDSIVMSMCAA